MDTQEEKFPPRQSIAEWFASLGLQEDAKSERFMAQLMKVFSRNKYWVMPSREVLPGAF